MPKIEDYALLGDLQTAALVDRGGSIDWLCFPRFDSGACFAALLGGQDNGCWSLAPSTTAKTERRYLHDTLVLETTWTTGDGSVARVLDFMPPRGQAPDHRAHRRGHQGPRPLPFGADDPLRLRTHRPVGAQAHARGGHARRDRGARRALLPHARRDARRGHANGVGVLGRRGRARPVRVDVVPVARGRSRGHRPRAGARGHRGVLAGVERRMPARASRRLGGPRPAVADRAESAHLRPDRRDRRGGYDVAARVDRLGPQLGLPLLLAARRDSHPARSPSLQPRRRGGKLAALADPCGRG